MSETFGGAQAQNFCLCKYKYISRRLSKANGLIIAMLMTTMVVIEVCKT